MDCRAHLRMRVHALEQSLPAQWGGSGRGKCVHEYLQRVRDTAPIEYRAPMKVTDVQPPQMRDTPYGRWESTSERLPQA